MVEKKTCYILVIKNPETEFQEMRHELQKRDLDVKCFHVDTIHAMEEAIDIREWDLFIALDDKPDFCNSPIVATWKYKGKGAPLIVVTDNRDKERTLEILDCGVSDVVARDDLHTLVPAMERWLTNHSIQEEFREKLKFFDDTLLLMREAVFEIRTLEDAKKLADHLALICPEPEKRVFGLRELIINAIEHSNLGISYKDKTELNEKDLWAEEVERRLALPENVDKFVRVSVKRNRDQISFLVKDQGEGFDWQSYIHADPFRSYNSHGYGIAMAKGGSFDKMEYQGCGNEVMAVVAIKKPTDAGVA